MVIVVNDNRERLQKVMASSGVASRRKCEEIITAGRVKVNGKVVTELGTKVNKKDIILVDGKPLMKETLVYYALHKPQGYTTLIKEKSDGRNVLDLFNIEDKKQNRLFPIGGLDYDASGIIIITNDGTLSYRLTKSAKDKVRTKQMMDGYSTQYGYDEFNKDAITPKTVYNTESLQKKDVNYVLNYSDLAERTISNNLFGNSFNVNPPSSLIPNPSSIFGNCLANINAPIIINTDRKNPPFPLSKPQAFRFATVRRRRLR